MADPIKGGGAFSDPRARPILLAAERHINELGGIDQTFEKYADPAVGGITQDGVDRFLKDADVGFFSRKAAAGPMHEAIDSLGTKDNVIDKSELEKAWKLMQSLSLPVKG
jgi:hypothetical protein